MQEKIICPECGLEVKNLISHIRIHHNEIKNKKTFFEYYPNYNGKFQIDSRKKQKCVCPICGKEYNYNNSLLLHIKNVHPDKYDLYHKGDNRICAKLICPICGKNYTDIKQHIERMHDIKWESFCNQYNWDIKLTKYVSDEYRQHLSENKKIFYHNSLRGKELRKNQSEIWKYNNPAKDRKILEKAIYNRSYHNNIPTFNNRGIKIQYKNNTFRSLTEFIFYNICKINNLNIKYESNEYIVKYYNSSKKFITTYLPDFYIDNFGLIELKSLPREVKLAKDEEKYLKVSSIYKNLNIPYYILDLNSALKILNLDYEKYEIKDIIRNIIYEGIQNNELHIWCKSNSRNIKYYLDVDELNNIDCITLIDKK